MSPSEIVEPAPSGGSIFAPVHGNGRFYPIYRFDFTLYLGNGRHKGIATGFAYRAVQDTANDWSQSSAITTKLPTSVVPFYSPPELFYRIAGNSPFIEFEKVYDPAISLAFKYGGKLRHRDFRHKFRELGTIERRALDDLLDAEKIVFIGCDPSTQYEREEA